MIAPSSPPLTADPMTLAGLCAALRRRRWFLLGPTAVLLTIAAISCVLSTPRYKATTEIQVQRDAGDAFGLQSTLMGQDEAAAAGDSLDYAMTLQTEVGILRSPALAAAVIEAEHLESTPDYFLPRPAEGLPALLATLKPWRTPFEPLTTPLAEAPNRRYVAEKIFKAHLKVTPLPGTRLVDIAYSDVDPRRAATVANTIARVLADMAFQQRFTATLQGSSWLAGQLDELRARTEQAQAKAAALQRGTGMFGNDASRNVVLERLDSLNQTLTAAESNRILKESIDKVAESASPELISSLSGNSSTGSVASINTSLSLLQGLRQQEAQTRSELAEASVRYGPAYPKIGELRAQLAGIDASISAETARLGQRAHTDWQVALRQEQAARAAFEEQKQLATRQNDTVLAYEMARQEADGSRDLYEGLLAKLKQASLLQGLRANNVSVVSAAQIPPPARPSSPNIPLRLGAGLAAGLFAGFSWAAAAELTDSSIHSIAEVEKLLGVPLLAVLPSIRQQPAKSLRSSLRLLPSPRWSRGQKQADALVPPMLPVLDCQVSVFGEGLRSLRTALDSACKAESSAVILVTSCLPGEGKTTLAANLAALLAQRGSRVLLVDADLRRPALHVYSAGDTSAGFAMALSGPRQVAVQRPVASMPNLHMLSGTELPPFPSELLASPRFRELIVEWRAAYDYVVLDSPPVLPVTDAVLLSRHSDATLLVARHRQTTRQALRRGVEALQRQSAGYGPIGVVLNDVARESGEFYEYFGYAGEAHASQGA